MRILPSMAEEATNLADAVASSANGPAKIAVAGMGASEEHKLTDQIAVVKFLQPDATRSRVGGGIKFTKASAGGAVR